MAALLPWIRLSIRAQRPLTCTRIPTDFSQPASVEGCQISIVICICVPKNCTERLHIKFCAHWLHCILYIRQRQLDSCACVTVKLIISVMASQNELIRKWIHNCGSCFHLKETSNLCCEIQVPNLTSIIVWALLPCLPPSDDWAIVDGKMYLWRVLRH